MLVKYDIKNYFVLLLDVFIKKILMLVIWFILLNDIYLEILKKDKMDIMWLKYYFGVMIDIL